MRIKINFKPTNNYIKAIDNVKYVISYLHRIIGENNQYHDKPSHYAITPLMRGKYNKELKSFNFPYGTYIIFSTIDDILINKIFNNIYKTEFGYDLNLFGIEIIEENFTNGNNYVTTLSPILLFDNSIKNIKTPITFENKIVFENLLTERTIKKLKNINNNLYLEDFKINLTNNNDYNKINIIPVNNIPNKASQCNLKITTNKNVMDAIYNVGLGQSTGCGFGTIYNTNKYQYYNLK